MAGTPDSTTEQEYNHPIANKYVTHDDMHEVLEQIEEMVSATGINEWAINEDWTVKTDECKATLVNESAFHTAFEEIGIESDQMLTDVINAHRSHATNEADMDASQSVDYLVTTK